MTGAECKEQRVDAAQHHPELPDAFNQLTSRVIGAAIKVHRALGPGLLESAYSTCLVHELRKDDLHVESEVALPLMYDGVRLDAGYRLDLLVEKCVVVELKTVEQLLPIHDAQILTYMKLSRLPIGLLMNFNVNVLTKGVRRFKLAEHAPLHFHAFSGLSGPRE